MPFVSGFLRVRGGGHPDQGLPGHEGETDPGYGLDLGGHPDQGLPGGGNIPGHLPAPPPTWPPLSASHPIQPAPGVPPGTIWPSPGRPDRPNQGLPGGGHASGQPVPPPSGGRPDQGLPSTPGTPGHDLPSNTFWVVAGIPGVGWRYVCVDPSLTAGTPLPPTATPKV